MRNGLFPGCEPQFAITEKALMRKVFFAPFMPTAKNDSIGFASPDANSAEGFFESNAAAGVSDSGNFQNRRAYG